MNKKIKKNRIVFFYPSYDGMGDYHWFPFPYLYLSPFLTKAGFDVTIIDARVDKHWRDRLKEVLTGALCLGVTSMTGSDIRCCIEAAKIARKINKCLPIIWGGPHATAEPDQTIMNQHVDICVSGQGEGTIVEIAERLSEGRRLESVSGIRYKDRDKIIKNKKSPVMSFNYDIFPAYDLLDMEKYRSPNNIVSVFTARGCPFNCTFCTTGDKGYSERTFEQVRAEVGHLVNTKGFKNIFFQDGTFFTRKAKVLEIADWLVRGKMNIKWKAKARANSLPAYSDKEIGLLNRSGLRSLFFGIESGSGRILKKMQKNTKPADAEKSADICRRNGIEFYTSFMFAAPGETVSDLNRTISHIKRLKKINPNTIFQNCIYIPLPNTPMYEEACRSGYVPPERLEAWADRSISSRFEKRDDITWMPRNELKRYIEIYNSEFGEYRHVFEREKTGAHKSVFADKTRKLEVN